jgi:hypothetical protein
MSSLLLTCLETRCILTGTFVASQGILYENIAFLLWKYDTEWFFVMAVEFHRGCSLGNASCCIGGYTEWKCALLKVQIKDPSAF